MPVHVYEHKYIRFTTSHDARPWALLEESCQLLHVSLPAHIVIKDSWGENTPTFTDTEISFNGDSNSKLCWWNFEIHRVLDEDDTAYFNQMEYFDRSCETKNHPYDFFVKCVLSLYKYYFPDVHIASTINYPNWKPALDFIKQYLYLDLYSLMEAELTKNANKIKARMEETYEEEIQSFLDQGFSRETAEDFINNRLEDLKMFVKHIDKNQ